MNAYSHIAGCYDRINGAQYRPYAEFLVAAFGRYARIPVREVLDLGCGTGGIAALLADRGYDMTALDRSVEMLSAAAENNAGKNTLLLCQDMRAFELYGTVQAVYSSFDCLNYLPDAAALRETFSLVRNYLEPGGVFVFDVNTRYRYAQIFGQNCFVYDLPDGMLVWQNDWDAANARCDFVLDRFTLCADGLYRRETERHRQYCHTPRRLERLLAACGFALRGVFGSHAFEAPADTDEKCYYIAERL